MQRRPLHRPFQLERLERRELFAGDLATVSWNDGVVYIQGTEGPNSVVVRNTGSEYLFDGTDVPRFPASYPQRIVFYGGGGDDAIYNDASIAMTAYGGAGDDTITGGHVVDIMYGGAGNDFLRGRSGNDFIYGGADNDKLCSDLDDAFNQVFQGSDSLYGQAGNDILDGSIDIDSFGWNNGVLSVSGTNRTDRGDLINVRQNDGKLYIDGVSRYWTYPLRIDLVANGGNDTVYNDSSIAMTAYGGAGDDTITGGHVADSIYGGAGSDFLRGRSGNDYIYGGADNDKLYSDLEDGFHQSFQGSDALYGEAGNDILDGSIDIDSFRWNDTVLIVHGTERTDRGDRIILRQNDGKLYIDGVNRFWTYPSCIKLSSRDGNDTIYNDTNMPVTADGGAGDDTITGGSVADSIYGGAGQDLLRGGFGSDSLFGGAGNDTYSFDDATRGPEFDSVHETAGQSIQGTDTLDFRSISSTMGVHLAIDGLFATTANREVRGTAYHLEKVYSGTNDDTLRGSGGGDYLNGGAGNDKFEGGGGTDIIDGGLGVDEMLSRRDGITLLNIEVLPPLPPPPLPPPTTGGSGGVPSAPPAPPVMRNEISNHRGWVIVLKTDIYLEGILQGTRSEPFQMRIIDPLASLRTSEFDYVGKSQFEALARRVFEEALVARIFQLNTSAYPHAGRLGVVTTVDFWFDA